MLSSKRYKNLFPHFIQLNPYFKTVDSQHTIWNLPVSFQFPLPIFLKELLPGVLFDHLSADSCRNMNIVSRKLVKLSHP